MSYAGSAREVDALPRPSGCDVILSARRSPASIANKAPWPLTLFMIVLVLPPETGFSVAGFFLSPQRMVLLAAVLPCVWLLFARRAGAIRLCDGLMLAHAVWALATFISNHGLEQGIKSGGIYSVEVLGSYLLARLFIRNLNSFLAMAKLLVAIILLMACFAVPESLTGRHFLREAFQLVLGGSGLEGGSDERFGFTRAYGTFQHPILYGLFCSSGFALSWYSLPTNNPLRRVGRTLGILVATLASVSSGALMAVVVQLLAICWERITRRVHLRWVLLGVMLVVGYGVVEVLSNRSAMTVLISYLTFNPHTGYTRQLIWEYGSAEVWRHPITGIGFNDWQRPEWMHSSSVDNFWLLTAMRHGIPGFLTLAGALALIVIGLLRKRLTDTELGGCRMGWLVCIAGLSMGAVTVHFWGSALTFYCFLLGSAVWIIDRDAPRPNHASRAVVVTRERASGT